jgi:hypothetical protein
VPAHPFRYLCLALVSLPCLILLQPLHAQASAPATTTTPSGIPLSHLYLHFLLYEAHLEHLQQAHPVTNPKGMPVKEHLRIKTGLTAAEWQSVSTSSLRMESTQKSLDAQAGALVLADRKTCQADPGACTPTAPNSQQVRYLLKQRQLALDTEIATLESALGPDTTTKLRTYLQNDFATHVKVKPTASTQTAPAVSQ